MTSHQGPGDGGIRPEALNALRAAAARMPIEDFAREVAQRAPDGAAVEVDGTTYWVTQVRVMRPDMAEGPSYGTPKHPVLVMGDRVLSGVHAMLAAYGPGAYILVCGATPPGQNRNTLRAAEPADDITAGAATSALTAAFDSYIAQHGDREANAPGRGLPGI